ncbi:MAG TPA: glycosyltransferase family 2 protein [Rubrobacter sp.]|nr:glycosyltransferase family 2 protein [Rubrobacter sp.]
MKFSVVVVNYDSWPFTLRCVGALNETGCEDFEVVIVDNDQRPAPRIPHDVILVRNPVNEGFARACNRGISASAGEYVILLNPDALVGRDFFERAGEFLDGNPRAGIAGPRILDGAGNLQLSARREVGFASGILGRTSFLTRLFPKSSIVKRFFPAAGVQAGPTQVDWVSGACMMVRRRTLEETGLLDGRFFMYFEDADLCRRAREAGWLVYYLPDVEVLHHTGASSRARPRAIWRLHKSAFLYHRKHGAHGPLNLYSLLVLLGLSGRALAKLGVSLAASASGKGA